MGNICRSPAAEGLFLHYLETQDRATRDGAGRIEVDSAGTIAHHVGQRPDARMIAAASRRGYELPGRARQVVAEDLERFDLVVAMDRENLRDLLALDGANERRAEISLLSRFLDPASAAIATEPSSAPDVPDPYYGAEAGFERVLDMIEAACPAIFEHLVEHEGARPIASP